MSEKEKMNIGEVRRKNKKLLQSVEDLINYIDTNVAGRGKIGNSDRNVANARRTLEDLKYSRNILPPWERKGYDSKQAWLDAQE